jgi:hypothetical protein
MIDLNQLVLDQIKGMDFGSIQLTLKVHKGLLFKVDVSRSSSVKVDRQAPDSDAAGIIISALKKNQNRNAKGSLGFAVLYDAAGKPLNVQIHEFVEEQQ